MFNPSLSPPSQIVKILDTQEISLHFLQLFSGEHIKNWRRRYFILLDDGSLLGFKNKPETNIALAEPLNNFTVKGCQIMKAVHNFCINLLSALHFYHLKLFCINTPHVYRIVQSHLPFSYVVFSGQQ